VRRREEILKRKEELKQRAPSQRIEYNLGRCNHRLTGKLTTEL
jgi:hypothetical protein